VRGNLDVGDERAVDAKAYAGFEASRHGFDVNIRRLLVVRVDDEFVDELDQFVVGSGRLQRIVVFSVVDRTPVHVGEHLVYGGVALRRAKQLLHGLVKIGPGRHAIGHFLGARKHLRNNA